MAAGRAQRGGDGGRDSECRVRVLIAWRVRHDPWSVFHRFGALSVVVIAINSARWSRRGKVVWRGRTYGARDTRVRKSG